MFKNETIAFGGNVSMLSEKVKTIVKVFDDKSLAFEDNATATSKQIKKELDNAGFKYWTFET